MSALALAVAFWGLATPAGAKIVVPQKWDNVILTTSDGWEYHDISVELLDDGRSLRVIRPDGSMRSFPLSQVKSIHDQIGRDITPQVIPGWKGTPGGMPLLIQPQQQAEQYHEVGGTPPETSAQRRGESLLPFRFRTAISAGAGMGWPRGDWFVGEVQGPSLHGQIRIALSGNVYLGFGYRRQYLRSAAVDPDFEPQPANKSHRSGGLGDSHLNQWLFTLGFMPRVGSFEEGLPYLELGVARVEHFGPRYEVNPAADAWSRTAVLAKPGLVAQAGLLLPFGKGVGLDLAGTALYTGYDLSDYRSSSGKGLILGAQAALVLFFGD